jgi:GGDEF domain-containing protein
MQRGEFVARVGGDEFVAVMQDYFIRVDAKSLGTVDKLPHQYHLLGLIV